MIPALARHQQYWDEHTATSMSLAIETKQLTRYFDDFCAVDKVDLRVERGTFYGFLGPNGAGKSTTIKMLTGLMAASEGQALVLGKNMFDINESLKAKSMIGVVPEDLALFDNLTAREHLTFIGRMYLLPADTIRQRIDELLSLMGLENDEKKLTIEYSHGMKKKLALASALLPNPDLLFLDEPFEGVDAVTSRKEQSVSGNWQGRRRHGRRCRGTGGIFVSDTNQQHSRAQAPVGRHLYQDPR